MQTELLQQYEKELLTTADTTITTTTTTLTTQPISQVTTKSSDSSNHDDTSNSSNNNNNNTNNNKKQPKTKQPKSLNKNKKDSKSATKKAANSVDKDPESSTASTPSAEEVVPASTATSKSYRYSPLTDHATATFTPDNTAAQEFLYVTEATVSPCTLAALGLLSTASNNNNNCPSVLMLQDDIDVDKYDVTGDDGGLPRVEAGAGGCGGSCYSIAQTQFWPQILFVAGTANQSVGGVVGCGATKLYCLSLVSLLECLPALLNPLEPSGGNFSNAIATTTQYSRWR